MPASGIKEIKYGTELHGKVLQAILARYDYSKERMQDFYERWRKAEEANMAYMPAKDIDLIRKSNRDNSGVPEYTTIVVPYNYAMLKTAHTYWASVLLGRTPILQYIGTKGESAAAQEAVDSIMNYQVQVGEWLIPLFVWLHDAGLYGVGVLYNYWDERYETVGQIVEEPVEFLGIPIPGKTRKIQRSLRIKGYHGNRVFNVRPFDWFPDPRVSFWDLQRGEYSSRVYDESWLTLLRLGRDGLYFNLEEAWRHYIEDREREQGSGQTIMPFDYTHSPSYVLDDMDKGFQNILEMQVEIVPSDWNLGSGKTSEKWQFTVANRAVIVGAQPMGWYHNKFSYHIINYEVDGYQTSGRSIMDITQPLNDTMTWLFNSHMYNVRKAQNDQIVYDPSKVETRDVLKGGPGRIWRLKPTAYGTDVRSVYAQMATMDVTAQHLKDGMVVAELMQQLIGSMMGNSPKGGRKTATQSRQEMTVDANRLRINAQYMSSGGFKSLARIALQTTQQMYKTADKFRILGSLMSQETAREIPPEEIAGFFDYITVDGSLPVDKMAIAAMWKELMKEMVGLGLHARYDIAQIFEYVAEMLGLRAISKFRVQMGSPEQLMQLATAGNVVPIGGAGGKPKSSGSATGDATRTTGVPGTPQVSGMGPVA